MGTAPLAFEVLKLVLISGAPQFAVYILPASVPRRFGTNKKTPIAGIAA